MWRAILVDDEEFVRAELAALFPWDRYQFDLIGEAENAQTAIDLIEKANPDLVITDIRMPEIDGLELTSWLGQHHPQLVVAVVSAYNDFPLVREALRLGAVDYLIKAEATFETAGVFLKRISEILERRYSAQHKQEELAGNAARYHLLAIESFWRDMLTRASDEVEIEGRAHQLGIVLDHIWFGLIFIHGSIYHAWKGDNQQALRVTLQKKIREKWDWDWTWNMIDIKQGNFIIVASQICETPNPEAIKKLQEIASHLAFNDTEKWTTSASSALCSFQDLPGNFREVREVNLLRLYYQEGSYIEASDLLKLRQAAPPKVFDLLTAWERILRGVEPEAIRDFLDNVFEEVLPKCFSPEAARRLVLDFINTLRRVSFEYQVRWEEVGNREPDLPELLEQAETVHDWRIRIENLVTHYIQSAKVNVYPQVSLTIRKALDYIQSNFTRDLSLEEVARSAGVSKSYLCRVFPEYAGEHFSDYLQRLRIERAKELLRFTNDHIYEIASKVGFWNSRYFSKIFHDVVGMTPADYRRDPPVIENKVGYGGKR